MLASRSFLGLGEYLTDGGEEEVFVRPSVHHEHAEHLARVKHREASLPGMVADIDLQALQRSDQVHAVFFAADKQNRIADEKTRGDDPAQPFDQRAVVLVKVYGVDSRQTTH